jgi:hypothetical protein
MAPSRQPRTGCLERAWSGAEGRNGRDADRVLRAIGHLRPGRLPHRLLSPRQRSGGTERAPEEDRADRDGMKLLCWPLFPPMGPAPKGPAARVADLLGGVASMRRRSKPSFLGAPHEHGRHSSRYTGIHSSLAQNSCSRNPVGPSGAGANEIRTVGPTYDRTLERC